MADRFDSQPGAPGLLLAVLAATPLFKTETQPQKSWRNLRGTPGKKVVHLPRAGSNAMFCQRKTKHHNDNEIRRDGRGRVMRRSGRSSSEIKKSSRRKKQEQKEKIRPNYQLYEQLRRKLSTIFSLNFQAGLTTDTWCRHLVRHEDSGWSKTRYHS